jgi:hypothetical protein
VSDTKDAGRPKSTPDTDAFIERNWFHLDHGWIELGSGQITDKDQREVRRDVQNVTARLVEEMASQYNTAVVSPAHYQAIWASLVARAMDLVRAAYDAGRCSRAVRAIYTRKVRWWYRVPICDLFLVLGPAQLRAAAPIAPPGPTTRPKVLPLGGRPVGADVRLPSRAHCEASHFLIL